MARVRKVPLVYGQKRVFHGKDGLAIVQSVFCGECNSLTQSVTIQIGKVKADREKIPRVIKIGFACKNSEKHRDGKNYIWPLDDWILPRR